MGVLKTLEYYSYTYKQIGNVPFKPPADFPRPFTVSGNTAIVNHIFFLQDYGKPLVNGCLPLSTKKDKYIELLSNNGTIQLKPENGLFKKGYCFRAKERLRPATYTFTATHRAILQTQFTPYLLTPFNVCGGDFDTTSSSTVAMGGSWKNVIHTSFGDSSGGMQVNFDGTSITLTNSVPGSFVTNTITGKKTVDHDGKAGGLQIDSSFALQNLAGSRRPYYEDCSGEDYNGGTNPLYAVVYSLFGGSLQAHFLDPNEEF